MAKHFLLEVTDTTFVWKRLAESIGKETNLDGENYLFRSSFQAANTDAAGVVQGYKLLANMEKIFKSLRSRDLHS